MSRRRVSALVHFDCKCVAVTTTSLFHCRCAVDMWSLGCVLVELHHGTCLFPSKTLEELWHDMRDWAGGEKAFSCFAHSGKLFSRWVQGCKSETADVLSASTEKLSDRINERSGRQRPLSEYIADPALADFVRQCLQINPVKRLSPEAALAHPLFSQFGNSCAVHSQSVAPAHPFSSRQRQSPDFLAQQLRSLGRARRLALEAEMSSEKVSTASVSCCFYDSGLGKASSFCCCCFILVGLCWIGGGEETACPAHLANSGVGFSSVRMCSFVVEPGLS